MSHRGTGSDPVLSYDRSKNTARRGLSYAFVISLLIFAVPVLAATTAAQLDAETYSQLHVQQAQREAQALEKQLVASERRNTALQSQVEAVRQRADQAILAAQQAESNLVKALRESEEKTHLMLSATQSKVSALESDAGKTQKSLIASIQVQTAAARDRDQMQWILLVMLSVICLALTGGLMTFVFYRVGRRTASQIQQFELIGANDKAESARQGDAGNTGNELAPAEYLLDGTDDKGVRYKLQVPGRQLQAEVGVVIGRNPQGSPYIIDHADVSRKHVRMRMMQGRIFIEDLGSTNGTSVNGQSIDERGPTSVSSGDQIIIGSVVMQLQVVGV